MPPERQRRLLADLEPPLAKFAAATGLTLALYDEAGQRCVGPLGLTPLGVLLSEAGAWLPDGMASAIERRVAAQAIESGRLASSRVAELAVWALPLRISEITVGAVVFGWVPDTFGSSLGAAQLSKSAGTDSVATWRLLRACIPVSSQRLTSFAELLENLLVSHAYHLEYFERSLALSRTRDQFTARAAHELRSPLAAISVRVEYLLLNEPRDQVRAELGKIAASVESQARLIEDLIEASQTLTGQLKVTLAPTNLRDLAIECLESFAPAAHKKGVELTADGLGLRAAFEDAAVSDSAVAETAGHKAAGHDVWVQGDAVRLKQALSNLIGNALKFTGGGGRITLQMDAAPTEVALSITDTGRGLTSAQLERVFDAFYKSEYDNETGLGLGLAITRQIVDLHGGTLEVSSPGPDLGATFTMRLPRGE